MEQVVKDLDGPPVVRAMRTATLLVQRDARIYAPVDTGRLRASITPQVVQMAEVVEGIVGSNVSYARWQEEGNRYMKGKRFLQRAYEQNKERIMRMFEQVVRGIVNR